MSIIDSCRIQSPKASNTTSAGASLASSLYRSPLTIDLLGELGSGKTTFVQGLGVGLGLSDRPVSPTFALEQRYGETLCHIDLCRLDPTEAMKLLEHSDDFPGIRAVEWARNAPTHRGEIHITFEDARTHRVIDCHFQDIPLPSESDIQSMWDELAVPPHIRAHMETVAHVADKISASLRLRAVLHRPMALRAAALLHDALRYVDFRSDEETKRTWEKWKKQYGTPHEPAMRKFLTDRGFPEIGKIVESHRGKHRPGIELPTTIEQKALAYADKRVDLDRIVTLDERFEQLIERHQKDAHAPEELAWQESIRTLERELFPNSPTF